MSQKIFEFSNKKIRAALMRMARVSGEEWEIVPDFVFEATNVGPNDQNLHPAAILALKGLKLQEREREGRRK